MFWRRRRPIAGQRILVTGASSGIGRELARRLAAKGATLLLTARREDRLADLADELLGRNAIVEYVAGDIVVSDVQAELVAVAQQKLGGLDALINNAGAGAVGSFVDADPARTRTLMELNYFAPVGLIRRALPTLQHGREPLIVNVGSVLGHVAMPLKSDYCASKFALRGFSDALRIELKSEGIDLLWVAPNTTRSEFFESLIDQQGSVAKNPFSMSPSEVARQIVDAMERRRDDLVLTLSARWLIRLDFLWPELLRWFQKRTV